MRTTYKQYGAASSVLLDYNAKTADERGKRLSSEVKRDIWVIITAGTISLVAGIAASVLVVLSIGKVLRRVATTIGDGAE